MRLTIFTTSAILSVLLLHFWIQEVPKELITNSPFINGRSFYELVYNTLTFAPFVLFFSTLSLQSRTLFDAWWKFSKFSIPIIFLAVFIINLRFHHPQGASGFINFEDAIDRAFILLLYAAFSLVSAWILLRTYLRSREDRT